MRIQGANPHRSMLSHAILAEAGQQGYLLTDSDDYLAPTSSLGRVSFLHCEIQRMMANGPAEQEWVRAFAPVLQHKLEETDAEAATPARGGFGSTQ
jgi:CHASE3 domain sensor protein